MAMDEKTRQALLLAGVSADQLDLMEGRYDTAREDYRALQGPQGRQAGRVFVAANPLEHIGHGLSKWAGRREVRKKGEDVKTAREQIKTGREAFSEVATQPVERPPIMSSSRRGGAKKPVPYSVSEKIDNIGRIKSEVSLGIGHSDDRIHTQAAAAMARLEKAEDRIIEVEQNRITNEYKKRDLDIKQTRSESRSKWEKDMLGETIRDNNLDHTQEMAKIAVLKEGSRVDLTASQEAKIGGQRHRLAFVQDAQARYKDSYAQPIREQFNMEMNIPWTGDAMIALATVDAPFIKDEVKEAARFYASWATNYTMEQRNEMFGATLTPSEKQAWKSSLELNPDSDPKYARAVMLEVERVLKTRMRHEAEQMIASGSADELYFNELYGKEWKNWDTMALADKKEFVATWDVGAPTPEDLSDVVTQSVLQNKEDASIGSMTYNSLSGSKQRMLHAKDYMNDEDDE